MHIILLEMCTGGKRSDLVVTVWNFCHAISQLRWVYWYGVHCGVRQLFYLFPRLYVRVAGDIINQISPRLHRPTSAMTLPARNVGAVVRINKDGVHRYVERKSTQGEVVQQLVVEAYCAAVCAPPLSATTAPPIAF